MKWKIQMEFSRDLKFDIPVNVNTCVICLLLLFATTVAKVTVQTVQTEKNPALVSPLWQDRK